MDGSGVVLLIRGGGTAGCGLLRKSNSSWNGSPFSCWEVLFLFFDIWAMALLFMRDRNGACRVGEGFSWSKSTDCDCDGNPALRPISYVKPTVGSTLLFLRLKNMNHITMLQIKRPPTPPTTPPIILFFVGEVGLADSPRLPLSQFW